MHRDRFGFLRHMFLKHVCRTSALGGNRSVPPHVKSVSSILKKKKSQPSNLEANTGHFNTSLRAFLV